MRLYHVILFQCVVFLQHLFLLLGKLINKKTRE